MFHVSFFRILYVFHIPTQQMLMFLAYCIKSHTATGCTLFLLPIYSDPSPCLFQTLHISEVMKLLDRCASVCNWVGVYILPYIPANRFSKLRSTKKNSNKLGHIFINDLCDCYTSPVLKGQVFWDITWCRDF
jgi:hypothetical protein